MSTQPPPPPRPGNGEPHATQTAGPPQRGGGRLGPWILGAAVVLVLGALLAVVIHDATSDPTTTVMPTVNTTQVDRTGPTVTQNTTTATVTQQTRTVTQAPRTVTQQPTTVTRTVTGGEGAATTP